MITKPTLILDEKRCRKNIEEMVSKVRRNKVDFRPHFKTHQSLEIGRWFKELDVNKITVSSLSMAEYFSAEWDDITVAFPVNILEISTINKLARKIRLNLLVESVDTAEFLRANLENEVGVFLKIDVGYHRTGIPPTKVEKIDEIIEISTKSNVLKFKGFLTHAGHSYECRLKEEVLSVHYRSVKLLNPLKARYKEEYPNLIISVGDTPTCGVVEDFSMFDEIRPGNFVFYDLSQQQIGSCEIDQIAVALACPIVAIQEDRNEIVIYGGGVHFSKERLEDDDLETIYGIVVENVGSTWGDPIPDFYVKNLSQEHGVVSVPASLVSEYSVGDILYVLPVHSCMTANLMKSYLTTEGKEITRL